MAEAKNGEGERFVPVVQVGGPGKAVYDSATGQLQGPLDLKEGEEAQAGVHRTKRKSAPKPSRDPKPVIDLEGQARIPKPPGMPRPYDPEMEDQYPQLWSMLTYSAYSDGCERILPTVRITREPGVFVACLQDHEMGRQCVVAGETWDLLWRRLDEAITQPLAWKRFRSMPNRTGEPFSLKKKKTGQPNT